MNGKLIALFYAFGASSSVRVCVTDAGWCIDTDERRLELGDVRRYRGVRRRRVLRRRCLPLLRRSLHLRKLYPSLATLLTYLLPCTSVHSVLWYCWLGVRKSIRHLRRSFYETHSNIEFCRKNTQQQWQHSLTTNAYIGLVRHTNDNNLPKREEQNISDA